MERGEVEVKVAKTRQNHWVDERKDRQKSAVGKASVRIGGKESFTERARGHIVTDETGRTKFTTKRS